jgi:hypothetical protein
MHQQRTDHRQHAPSPIRRQHPCAAPDATPRSRRQRRVEQDPCGVGGATRVGAIRGWQRHAASVPGVPWLESTGGPARSVTTWESSRGWRACLEGRSGRTALMATCSAGLPPFIPRAGPPAGAEKLRTASVSTLPAITGRARRERNEQLREVANQQDGCGKRP